MIRPGPVCIQLMYVHVMPKVEICRKTSIFLSRSAKSPTILKSIKGSFRNGKKNDWTWKRATRNREWMYKGGEFFVNVDFRLISSLFQVTLTCFFTTHFNRQIIDKISMNSQFTTGLIIAYVSLTIQVDETLNQPNLF